MTEATTLCCELCATPMTLQVTPGSLVRYFHCPQCGRWVASSYGDALVRSGIAREAPRPSSWRAPGELDAVKQKLQSWWRALDETDPYLVLGLHPSSPIERIRERFHELALLHHPDTGGDPDQMRRILAAWERIRQAKRPPQEPVKMRPSSSAAPKKSGRRR
jgi:hypothetical protein